MPFCGATWEGSWKLRVLALFPGGIGVGEMLGPGDSTLTIPFPFSLPEPFWLWVPMPWVCPWSFWVRCGVAEVETLHLCSWPWPELVTRTLTGCGVLGHVGHRSCWAPGGSHFTPCGHHVSTLLLPSHLPWPGADHAGVGARGYFELCSQVLLQLGPVSGLGLAGGTGVLWGAPCWAPSTGCPPRAAPECPGQAHTKPERFPHFFGVQGDTNSVSGRGAR